MCLATQKEMSAGENREKYYALVVDGGDGVAKWVNIGDSGLLYSLYSSISI